MPTPEGEPARAPVELWRVFPWDAGARAGAPYSPSYFPLPGGRGRFDLPRRLTAVAYLAESPDHAVAELIQPWRGQRIGAAHLRRASLPLGLVRVSRTDGEAPVADLCDAPVLVRTETAPDRSASRRRAVTQPLARALWEQGYGGLRWWSSFWGDWHTQVLFLARMRGALTFHEPELLTPTHPAVASAAEQLGIEVAA